MKTILQLGHILCRKLSQKWDRPRWSLGELLKYSNDSNHCNRKLQNSKLTFFVALHFAWSKRNVLVLQTDAKTILILWVSTLYFGRSFKLLCKKNKVENWFYKFFRNQQKSTNTINAPEGQRDPRVNAPRGPTQGSTRGPTRPEGQGAPKANGQLEG